MKRLPQDVLYESARMLFKKGKFRKALEMLERALRNSSTASRPSALELVYNLKIACLVAIGREEEAIEIARNCLRKHPQFSEVRANYRKLRKGQPEEIMFDDTMHRSLKRFRPDRDPDTNSSTQGGPKA